MSTVKIAAVGDILMWRNQISSAKVSDNEYSFDNMFREVAPLLKDADITIGNLETTLSGREKHYQKINPKTKWPMFNCPDELLDSLKKTGFNVLTTANNHCMDRGIEGLNRTLGILDGKEIFHTGTFSSSDKSNDDLILEVNGIRIGILAFTYGTNLNPLPSDKQWAVNIINDEMLSKIHKMKRKVDLTIVCLHFGREFHSYPNIRQKKWVQRCFEHGADVILGSHPHVIQPMETKFIKDIDGIEKERFVIYSLGNFISDIMHNNISTIGGIILKLVVTKTSQSSTIITNIEYVPTWVYRIGSNDNKKFKVVPISNYLRYKDEGSLSPSRQTMERIWIETTLHLGYKVKRSGGEKAFKFWGGFL